MITHKNSVYDDYPELEGFINNVKNKKSSIKKRVDFDNIYILQTIDREGNITDTKFALNVMTDAGYIASRVGNAMTYASGPGGTITAYEMKSEYAASEGHPYGYFDHKPISSEYSWASGALGKRSLWSCITWYAMTYDSETGFISQSIMFFKDVMLEYNLSGITRDIHINCITININGADYMCCKSEVYDSDGHISEIVKHPNERLYISVLLKASIHEDTINAAFNDNIFVFINPCFEASFQNTYDDPRKGSDSGSAPKGRFEYFPARLYKEITSYPTDRGTSSGDAYSLLLVKTQDNSVNRGPNKDGVVMTSYFGSNGDTVMTDPRAYISYVRYYPSITSGDGGYTSTLYQYVTMATMLSYDTYEELTSDCVYVNAELTSGDFDTAFGRAYYPGSQYGVFPCVDFTVNTNGILGYNYSTHDWDIQIPFIDEPDAYYNSSFAACNYTSLSIYNSPLGYSSNFVYANARPDLPLTSLNNSSVFYATDKYWDISTWTRILDGRTIPADLQHKRYYITSANRGALLPQYEQNVHRLNVGTSKNYTNVPVNNAHQVGFKPVVSYTNHWILGQEDLIYMDDVNNDILQTFKLKGPGNSDRIDPFTIRYGFDDKLVVTSWPFTTGTGSNTSYQQQGSPTAVRIYHGLDDPSTFDPTTDYTDLNLDLGNNAGTRYNNISYSYTSNGYVVIGYEGTHICAIIDVANETVINISNTSTPVAIYETNYCVYWDYSQAPLLQFVVYDMSTNTEHARFSIPSEYTTERYIFGLRDKILIKVNGTINGVSTTTVFCYNISSDVLTPTDLSIPINFAGSIGNTWLSSSYCSTAWFMNRLQTQLFHHDCVIFSDNTWTNTTASYKRQYVFNYDTNIIRGIYCAENVVGTQISYETYHVKNYYDITNYGMGPASYLTESPDHKHLLLVNVNSTNCSMTNYGCLARTVYFRPIVSDIGYMLDQYAQPGITSDIDRLNQAPYHFDEIQDTYPGAIVYWNNGIVHFNDAGTLATWKPLEWFLPFKCTGKTKTITAYNNPKNIKGGSFYKFATNRLLDDVTQIPNFQRDDMICFSGYIWTSQQWVAGWTTDKKNTIETDMRYPNKIKVSYTNGQTITVTITQKQDSSPSGLPNNMTFTWRLVTYNDNGSSVVSTSAWIANGGSLQLSADCPFAQFQVKSSNGPDGFLTPSMLDNIIISAT